MDLVLVETARVSPWLLAGDHLGVEVARVDLSMWYWQGFELFRGDWRFESPAEEYHW